MQTKTCKVCFKEFYSSLLTEERFVCDKCYRDMNPIFKKIKIDEVNGLAVYPYNDKLKDIIYRYKACGDIELKNVFFDKIARIIKIIFHDYYIVTIPSNKNEDEIRGFNHVKEAFNIFGLEQIDLIRKKINFKQSSLSLHERSEAKDRFELANKIDLSGKKILLCDDIITSGSSMSACIKLIKKLNPKKIKLLSISINCRKMIKKGERKK